MTRRGLTLRAIPVAGVALALAACSAVSDAGTRVSAGAASGSSIAVTAGSAPADAVAAARLADCPRSEAAGAAPSDGLPDVTLPCLGTGPAVRLAGLRGKPTVVNLWASWCEPCRDELPLLARLAESPSVRVLGINTENEPGQALSLLTDTGVHYASLRDDDGLVKTAMRASGLPLTLFVDADGVVTHVERAPIVSADQLRSLVSLHLGVTVAP